MEADYRSPLLNKRVRILKETQHYGQNEPVIGAIGRIAIYYQNPRNLEDISYGVELEEEGFWLCWCDEGEFEVIDG